MVQQARMNDEMMQEWIALGYTVLSVQVIDHLYDEPFFHSLAA